jgi:hypothetical protein
MINHNETRNCICNKVETTFSIDQVHAILGQIHSVSLKTLQSI